MEKTLESEINHLIITQNKLNQDQEIEALQKGSPATPQY